MSILNRHTHQDGHTFVTPKKGVLDLTLLTFKEGEKPIRMHSKLKKRTKGLIGIIKEFLNR